MRSCSMAQKIGKDNAKIVGDLHEKYGKGSECETKMDLANNQKGIDLAGSENCKSACMSAATSGQLIVLPQSQWGR
jgi:hypothetical protein